MWYYCTSGAGPEVASSQPGGGGGGCNIKGGVGVTDLLVLCGGTLCVVVGKGGCLWSGSCPHMLFPLAPAHSIFFHTKIRSGSIYPDPPPSRYFP